MSTIDQLLDDAPLGVDVDRDLLREQHDEALLILEMLVADVVVRELRRVMVDAIVATNASLLAAGPDDVLDLEALGQITDQWDEALRGPITNVLAEVYGTGTLAAWIERPEAHAAAAAADAGFARVVDTRALTYLSDATNRLRGVADSVWADVRGRLVEGIEAGDDVRALGARVRDALDVGENRALTIARTEAVGAANAGQLDGATALGVHGPRWKEWLATKDSRTRDSHYVADGQIVPIDGLFQVGAALMPRPHDGPAGEVVNCRCTMLFLDDDEARDRGHDVPLSDEEQAEFGDLLVDDELFDVDEFVELPASSNPDDDDFDDDAFEAFDRSAARWWRQRGAVEWESSLDDAQRTAITEYVGNAFPLNTWLRSGAAARVPGIGATTEWQALRDALDSTLTWSHDRPLRVWRGIARDADTTELFDAIENGTLRSVTDPGYQSTSMAREIADAFADDDGALFELIVPPGTATAPLGHSLGIGEYELLLARGSSWRVSSITRLESGQWHIVAEVTP